MPTSCDALAIGAHVGPRTIRKHWSSSWTLRHDLRGKHPPEDGWRHVWNFPKEVPLAEVGERTWEAVDTLHPPPALGCLITRPMAPVSKGFHEPPLVGPDPAWQKSGCSRRSCVHQDENTPVHQRPFNLLRVSSTLGKPGNSFSHFLP